MRLDKVIIERRLTHLMDALQILKEFQGRSLDSLTEDTRDFWAVQHGLQTCVQAVLDVAAHIVAASSGSVPDDYRGNLLALSRVGVLPRDFAERIAPMVGFRNILVHDYLDVDGAEVHRVLNEHLSDLEEFARLVTEHVRRLET